MFVKSTRFNQVCQLLLSRIEAIFPTLIYHGLSFVKQIALKLVCMNGSTG